MDLSPSAKFPFALQNSFTNGSVVEKANASTYSGISLDTNQRMMRLLNQEKEPNSKNIIEEDNERYAGEDDEDIEGTEGSEKSALSNLREKPRFGGMDGSSIPFPQTIG